MKIRVLHVEDNPGDARLMREILRDAGSAQFEIVLAQRMDEALERLKEGDFEVVLVDLSLPDAHGLETVHRMCTAAPQAPIVVLTGLDDETLAVQAAQVGAQDYLIKGRLDSRLCLRAIRYAIERHRAGQELRSQSLMDDLTGLYNRRGFLALAEQQIRLAHRERCDLALFFCDLDGMKEINDTFGHQEGDRALFTTAKILRETLREMDLVARLGGDEFTILALDSSGNGAAAMTARLREGFDAYNARTEGPYRLSMSVGLALLDPGCPLSVMDLLAEADQALYEQKRGRQRSRLEWLDRREVSHAGTR